MFEGLMFPIVLVGASFLSAVAALFVLPYLPNRDNRPGLTPEMLGEDTVFLFDNETLLDATPKARKLLDLAPTAMSDWQRFVSLMTPRFPDLTSELSRLADLGLMVLDEHTGEARMRARWLNGVARITLLDPTAEHEDRAPIDKQSLAALQAELGILRKISSEMPALVWQVEANGEVSWANRAYLRLVEGTLEPDEAVTWPLPHLFAHDDPETLTDGVSSRRLAIQLPDGGQRWFDCSATDQGGRRILFAQPADAAANAESALGNFRQTLVQTFAQLPTGLAIFSRSRHLVMFNPALTDLFLLEPQFLASRPSLDAFLDRLREKQMVPEQKNFKEWRQMMATLETEAAAGMYRETWALPSGQTYRLTGRPHPDGAVAFLFEDISSEVSLTRRFRAELAVSQAILDDCAEAIAVFSPSGTLTNANASYSALFEHDPVGSLGEINVFDIVEHWKNRTENAGAKALFDEMGQAIRARTGLRGEIPFGDGKNLIARVSPIAGGSTLVGFLDPQAATAPLGEIENLSDTA